MKLILALIIISILIICLINANVHNSLSTKNNQIEPFWDITPYEKHWKTFKCLGPECVKKTSYDCYKWCDYWDALAKDEHGEAVEGKEGGAENCRLRCADFADQQFDYLKWQDYTWNYLNPKFKEVSLLGPKSTYS